MIRIDGTGVKAFADQLRHVPREMRPALRREIRKAGDVLVRDIQGNASWSSRIPGATKLRVGFGARSSGVTVHVDAALAPHARPYEGITGRGNTFRHPVPGTDVWVEQATRPFIRPALPRNEERTVRAVQSVIDKVFGRL